MSIAVPDCSLLIDGLDRMSGSLLERHRTATVEQWARSLQAELEILAVSGAEQGPKKPRVAAIQAKEEMGAEEEELQGAEAEGCLRQEGPLAQVYSLSLAPSEVAENDTPGDPLYEWYQ